MAARTGQVSIGMGDQQQGQDRQAAPRFKRAHFKPRSEFAHAATELEQLLTALWEAVLNIDGLGVDDDFFEVGGESFAAVVLFTEMERYLGAMPPLSILLNYPTIRRIAQYLEESGSARQAPLIMPIRAQGERRLPLFAAHAAHGNVLFYRALLAHLSPDQPLHAIRARGLREGEAAHRSFEAMAADYVAEIRRIQPEGPYLLAGHCIGGLIAFAMAQQMRSMGQNVASVVMIDPDYHPNAVPWLYWRDPEAPAARFQLALLRPFWFARWQLRRAIARITGTPVVEYPAETGENRRRQDAVIAGLIAAQRAFRPKRYDGRVVILCSAERRRYLDNATLGWRAIAPQLEIVEISGSHDEVFFGALPAVGQALDEILAGLQPEPILRKAEHRAAAE